MAKATLKRKKNTKIQMRIVLYNTYYTKVLTTPKYRKKSTKTFNSYILHACRMQCRMQQNEYKEETHKKSFLRILKTNSFMYLILKRTETVAHKVNTAKEKRPRDRRTYFSVF